jgi:hypothetical protein
MWYDIYDFRRLKVNKSGSCFYTVGIVAPRHYGYAHTKCYCGTVSMVRIALNMFRHFKTVLAVIIFWGQVSFP